MKLSSEELDKLIDDSERIVDENWNEISGIDMKKHQIRNILDLAQATDSFRELKLFIKYQAGRKKIPENFSEVLIKHLQNIKNNYDAEAVRQSLGYIYRHFIWKESRKKNKGGNSDD